MNGSLLCLMEWIIRHDGAAVLLRVFVQSGCVCAVGLLLGWCVRTSAAARSVVYRAALAGVLLTPLVSLLLGGVGVRGVPIRMASPKPVPAAIPSVSAVSRASAPVLSDRPSEPMQVPATLPAAPELASGVSAGMVAQAPVPHRTAVAVLPVWLLVSAVLLVRLLWFHVCIVRLRRAACRADDRLASECGTLSQLLGVRPPQVLVSGAIGSPFATGVLSPAILLPESVAEQPGVDLVLMHELAHLKRSDCFWHLFAQIVCAVVFFQPLAWLLARRLQQSNDEVCDDHVLSAGSAAKDYASRLLSIAELCRSTNMEAAGGVGIIRPRAFLSRRIRRILDAQRSLSLRTSARTLLSTAAAVAAGVVVASLVGLDGAPVQAKDARSGTAGTQSNAADGATTPTLTVDVRVVDEEGKPVEGVVIRPNGLRTKMESGSHYRWCGITAVDVKTDAAGKATVTFPKYVQEEMETGQISFVASHSDYVQVYDTDYRVEGDEKPVVLEKGARVKVVGMLAGKSVDIVPQVAASKGTIGSDQWRPAHDGKRLESAAVPPGTVWLRAIHFREDGVPLFSKPVEFTAEKGKSYSHELELAPGCVVTGKLDPSVPRPVRNGRVVAEMWSPCVAASRDSASMLNWAEWTPVAEDGSFKLPPMPAGELEAIALCDGYRSENGTHYDRGGGSLGVPQMFVCDSATTQIEIAMAPAASCEVRVSDSAGQPIPKARVAFWPNAIWGKRGTRLFGVGGSSADFMRADDKEGYWRSRRDTSLFSASTDGRGIGVVSGLPAGEQPFMVTHSDYEMPVRVTGMRGTAPRREQEVDLKMGQTNQTSVTLVQKGTEVIGRGVHQFLDTRTSASTAPQCAADAPLSDLEKGLPVKGDDTDTELAGRVVGTDGKPLAGVRVDAWTWCEGNETHTDANGHFRLAGLDKGKKIEVRFSKEGMTPRYIIQQPLGELTEPLVLDSRTYFEGLVTDAEGTPVPGAEVRAATQGSKRADGVTITETVTTSTAGSDGAYRLYVQADVYDIQVRHEKGVARLRDSTIKNGESKQLNIGLSGGVHFQARVIDSQTSEPVAGARLYNWQRPGLEGTSDVNGKIEIRNLTPGKFEFDFKCKGYSRFWSDKCLSEWNRYNTRGRSGFQRNFDGLDFDLQPGMEPVTIVAEKALRITGKVLDPEGNPVAGATVAPALTGTGNSLTGDTRFSVRSEKDGSFEMMLPAGKSRGYNIMVHDGKYEEWRKWANGVLEPVKTMPGQEIGGVEIRLTRPAVVKGVVVDAAGKPVAGREVRASAHDRRENRYYDPTTETDTQGRFELRFVRPGKQYIQVAPFWLQAEEAPQGTSQIVTAEEGKPVEDVKLIAAPKDR